MKKQLIILVTLTISFNCFSQNSIEIDKNNYLHNFQIKEYSESIKYAKYDIENENLNLYTSAGMIPLKEKLSKELKHFIKKYKVKFPNFGCVAPNYKSVSEYNNQILNHLKYKYRGDWLEKINTEMISYMDTYVIGFLEWRTK